MLCLPWPDLRRFRTYKGNSVRDLLRAMRNKVSDAPHCRCSHSGRTLTPLLCPGCRNITTTSCLQTCRRLWASCRRASLATSRRASRGCWCTRMLPCTSAVTRDCSTRTIWAQAATRHLRGLTRTCECTCPGKGLFYCFCKALCCFGWGGLGFGVQWKRVFICIELFFFFKALCFYW